MKTRQMSFARSPHSTCSRSRSRSVVLARTCVHPTLQRLAALGRDPGRDARDDAADADGQRSTCRHAGRTAKAMATRADRGRGRRPRGRPARASAARRCSRTRRLQAVAGWVAVVPRPSVPYRSSSKRKKRAARAVATAPTRRRPRAPGGSACRRRARTAVRRRARRRAVAPPRPPGRRAARCAARWRRPRRAAAPGSRLASASTASARRVPASSSARATKVHVPTMTKRTAYGTPERSGRQPERDTDHRDDGDLDDLDRERRDTLAATSPPRPGASCRDSATRHTAGRSPSRWPGT